MHKPFAAPCSHYSSVIGRSAQPVARTSSCRSCPAFFGNSISCDIGLGLARSRLAWHQVRHTSSSSSKGLTAAVSVANEEQHEIDWESMAYEPGPAFKATLQMLEWSRLCEHLSKHASTALGKRMCQRLEVPVDMPSSIRMLQETRAMLAMENDFMSLLDYGGISTNEAESAIKRASKGGMVAAKQLRGLVTMLAGADRLKRQVQLVARQNNVTQKGSPLWPLLEAVTAVRVPGALMRDINSTINEDGELSDSSSEQVRTTRGKVRAITSRINNILKGFPGEASEKGGRLCIAAPAGTKISNGVMLGSSIGGGMVYIEPPQVVSLNNELAAARAEAMAAEEAVLWELSGRLMGCLEDVETAFSVVGWLDTLSAKVRFGVWMGAVMPQLTAWEDVFHRRSGTALRKQQQQQQQQQQRSGVSSSSSSSSSGSGASSSNSVTSAQQRQQQQQEEAVNWDALSTAGAAAGAVVHLRKFSHPLLLADYLEQRQQFEREARLYSGSTASSSSSNGSGSSSSSKKISSRLLGTRKEVVYKQLGLDGAGGPSDSSSGEGDQTPEERLAALKPPRPIDLVIQPETSVVVITGPNTGGKTATMKAFGLAVCMAKAGMLIPCQAPARLPCYSSVLADIGDEQSLTANLSTFSGHITRISAVRAEADGRSLLLLDELGTGTDPTEGAALGLALLKQLIKGGIGNGALTIATTHHSIMTSLKFEDARAENASVEFDEEKLGPTYKLLWGVPGRSNALNIASRLGLNPDIIAAARTRLAAGVAATNTAIAELEQVQEEVRQADLAALAVGADLDQKKQRLAAISELAKSDQIKLAQKRTAAIMEVAAAARALLKALKLERKAWRQSKAPGKISTQLDLALAESNTSLTGPAAAAANSLDSALETFKALEQTQRDITAYDVLQQQRQRQLEQQMLQQEAWVQDWARLLSKARATLAASIVAASSSRGQQEGGSSSSSSFEEDSELEAQIMALYATKEAKEQAQRAAAQQVVDSKISRFPADEPGQADQASKVDTKPSLEEWVSQELFAAGVTAVENALEQDEQLAAVLQAKQAAADAAEAELAAEQARQQAEQAKLVSALEQELDEWELDLAFFAPDQAAQEQQQQQQLEEETAAVAAAAAARREEELSMVRAFEDMLDLDGDWSSPASAAPATSASSSTAVGSSGSSSTHGLTGGSLESRSKVQQHEQHKQPSSSRQPAETAIHDGLAVAAGMPGSFDDLLDFLELEDSAGAFKQPAQQQQQQQQTRQQRKSNKKQKPVMKFKM